MYASFNRSIPFTLLVMSICLSAAESRADRPKWAAPPIERAVSVRDGRTDRILPLEAMLDALARSDVVFLGESHNDETTHRVELAVYNGLLSRKENKVVLALEMFERDVQAHLDDYLSGRVGEEEFLKQSRPWGNYRTAYRPLIERAKAVGRPVIASNFPRPLRSRVAREGSAILKTLKPDEASYAPREYFPNTEGYWRRVDNAIRGHAAMMRSGTGGDKQRLYSTQSLWDNAMGEACADALDHHPDHVVLHVNGGFHSAYWDGTVHQLKVRRPKTKIKTVAIVPVSDPATAETEGLPRADYVIYAESRAGDVNEGSWSVSVERGVKYRIRLPDKASDSARVPLLIWLADDGFNASDGLDLWKDRLGDEAALVVVEAPYRETQEDYGEGGRWFWADSFSQDMGAMLTAVERIWGYVLRHYPVDPQRVCVAGEGTGATVVATVALLTDRIDHRAVAFRPRRYSQVKDFSLPLPEFQGDDPLPDRSLVLVGDPDTSSWWGPELDQYSSIGMESKLVALTDDAWDVERQEENALRGALGLPLRPAAAGQQRRYIRLENDSPRARQWARLKALAVAKRENVPVAVLAHAPEGEGASAISTTLRPQAFAHSGALPKCPGPFGGTTVLVLPSNAKARDARAWLTLEKNDPLAADSRFHRLRIASNDSQRQLTAVLRKLLAEGRKNILIVPAVFCADHAWMRSLRSQVAELEDEMTFHWLPGLGGRPEPESGMAAGADLPTQHAIQVTLDPPKHTIRVTDRIELPDSLCRKGLSFTLSEALQLTGSEPAVAKVAPPSDGAPARYVLQSEPEDGVLKVVYEGVLNTGLSDQKEEYTRGFRETRGIIGPEGIYLDGDSLWIPRFNDQLIQFSVDVRLPTGWHVISQGTGTSRNESGRATWHTDSPMEQVYLVGGPLQRYTDAAGAVATHVYLHDDDPALARKYLDATARYLEMYRTLIGRYPYQKFALVENFWETGYGMPSFTLLGPQVIRFPFILTSSYPHEILHNWWGNSVLVDYEQGNWCEGLTAYLADHLIKEQHDQGADYRRSTLQKYRDYVRAGRDFPLAEFRARHSAATEAVGYGKALMMDHMLRRHIGDEAFRAGLARLYRDQRGKRASFADLQAAFETVADTQLGPFFQQWTRRTGAPAIVVQNVKVSRLAQGFAVRGSLRQTQEGEPYALDVPVTIRTEKGQRTEVVQLTTRSKDFRVTVDALPVSLHVDPQFDVFRLLDPRETPASIGQIFGEPRILAVLPAKSTREDQRRYRELLDAWKTEDHEIEIVADTQLGKLPADRCVWVLGRENRFAPALVTGNWDRRKPVMGGAVRLASQDVTWKNHSIVIVRRHPANVDKAVGLLVIEPPDAFAGLGRKLPHYGKYSYLAFEGREPTNRVKGQWSAGSSPLVVDLRRRHDTPLPPLVLEKRAALAELPPIFSGQVLQAHVDWLSAPQREGRGLGSQGLQRAADYIAKKMADAGLQPGGDRGTWFQHFTVDQGPEGKPVKTVNVIGVLPGTRAPWKDQSVVLGAHYDHLGYGWPDVRAGAEGKLHPGADDNASGVAVMLELARNLAAEGGGSRNLVCVAFSAEECGRLGSRYYVTHPRFPKENIRGVINLDTVGRLFDNKLAVHATATADEWQHIFRGCGFVTGIPNQIVPEGGEASDQMSFIEQGIPAVQIFTGAHGDYHRPSDTPDKVDAAGMVKVATFVKEALGYLLEREEPLTVHIGSASASHPPLPANHAGGRRVLFGTVPAFDYQGEGVKVDSLVPDSPAARAHFQPGDIILAVNGRKLRDLRAFSDILKTLEPGQEVSVEFLRQGASKTVKVVLQKR